ncbi:leucine-rich repeat-containing protein 74B-like [Lineus longissimus]|uniref:leucine-rich repeat-containing protein 74B-like n=1 Tax=Lineus longissimus TaxID=88925 RepID=UPI00315C9480
MTDIEVTSSSKTTLTGSGLKEMSLSDNDAYDTDLEDTIPPVKKPGAKGARAYIQTCENLDVHPVRRVIDALNDHEHELNLRYRNMGPVHARALAVGLAYNASIEYLDLRETGLGGEGGAHIGDMLKENHYMTDMNLAGNDLGSVGTAVIGEALGVNTCLSTLTLSENKIGDSDVRSLALGLQGNHVISFIDLSHNDIGEEGAKALASVLGSSSLERLNISWNKIRKKGGVALCMALAHNSSLKDLDISWNGLGFEGSVALGEMLRTNRCLRDIDLTNNRIHWEGVRCVASGLKVNTTLETLKIGLNPITMSGCQRLLDAACAPSSALAYIGFDDIPINSSIMEKAKKIMAGRGMTLVHAQVHDTVEVFGTNKRLRRKDDPLKMLFRYLHQRGIRVMDLFRTFYTDSENRVTIDQFIRGIKKCYLPMTEQEMMRAAKSIQDHTGKISYHDIKIGVRSVTMEIRSEERKKYVEEIKRKMERTRIMDIPEERRLQAVMQGSNGSLESTGSMTGQAIATGPYIGRQSAMATRYLDLEARTMSSASLPRLTPPTSHSAKHKKNSKRKASSDRSEKGSKS